MPSFQEITQFVSNVGIPASAMAYLLWAYGKQLTEILRLMERILEMNNNITKMLDVILDHQNKEKDNAK